jgi:signal transduction histidine kinase
MPFAFYSNTGAQTEASGIVSSVPNFAIVAPPAAVLYNHTEVNFRAIFARPTTPQQRRHTIFFIALLITCLIVAVPLGFLKQVNNRFYDFFLRLQPTHMNASPTVILAIDDDALRAHNTLPADRRLLAQVLDKVCAGQPAVVGLDLLYWEPGPPGADAELASALQRCGHTVLAAGVPRAGANAEWREPIPELARAASAIGHVHSNPDEDGEVREVMLEKQASHMRYWALALECLRQILSPRLPILETERTLEISDLIIPAPLTETDEAGQIRGGRPLYVNYQGEIPVIGLQDVLDGKAPASAFVGKAVLVGVTTSDDIDRKMTPLSYGVPMPGVEIHAHLLNTMLSGQFLVPWRDSTTLLAQLLIVALLGAALFRLHGVWLASVAVLLAIPVHVLPYFLLLRGEVVPAFALASAFWITLIAGGGFQYWTTWRYFLAADASQRRLRRSLEWVRHEVRSPLTAIQGSGELIGRYKLDDKRRQQISEMIGRESGRIGLMFERFLDVERLSVGEIQLRRDPVDLAAMVEMALERAKPFADRKHIEIQLSLAGPGQAQGDAELLEFAVYNLLSNAVKYSPDRSVVRITAFSEDGRARIEVRDQGAGISKQDADRIFERFYRTEDAELSGKPGLGLGLSIVREITRLHGGAVTLESKVGEGSAFTLSLPSHATTPS